MNRQDTTGWTLTIRAIFAAIVLMLPFVDVPAIAGQQVGDAALVQQFFPQDLIDEADADFGIGGPAPFQATDFVAADLNGTGSADFLIAAYTNGFSAVVRVLRRQGTSAMVVAEPKLPLIAGIYPSISLIDVDEDGRPEVVVGLSSARGAVADWIFKWDGASLVSIGPMQAELDGNGTTVLGDADFVDLTGSGTLQIVNPPEFNSVPRGSTTPATFTVFALNNGVSCPQI